MSHVGVAAIALSLGYDRASTWVKAKIASKPPELKDVAIYEEMLNGHPVLKLVFDTKQEFVLPVENLVPILMRDMGGDEVTDAVSHTPVGFVHFPEDDDEEGKLK